MSKKEYTVEGIEAKNPNQFGGMVSRAISIKAANVDFEKGINTIATTEAPAMVVDWERWQIVREILPMRYMEAPSNDKVPFLDSHSKSSLEKVKGSARNFKVEGDKLICDVFISKSESDLRQKIKEGHVDSVSIGYMTDREYTVEIPKGAKVNIDGIEYRNDYSDATPLVVRTWWKTHELSGVAIGADDAAKFRSAEDYENKTLLKRVADLAQEIEAIKAKDKSLEQSSGKGGLTYHEAKVRVNKHL